MSKITFSRALCIAGLALASVGLGSCIRLAPTGTFACEDDGDCDDGERCTALFSGELQCQPRCNSNADCAFPNGCDRGTCTAPSFRCYSSNVCTNYLCNADGYCNRSCRTSADCNAGYRCERQTCFYDSNSSFGGTGGYAGYGGSSGFGSP